MLKPAGIETMFFYSRELKFPHKIFIKETKNKTGQLPKEAKA